MNTLQVNPWTVENWDDVSHVPVSSQGYDGVFVEAKKHFARGGIDLSPQIFTRTSFSLPRSLRLRRRKEKSDEILEELREGRS